MAVPPPHPMLPTCPRREGEGCRTARHGAHPCLLRLQANCQSTWDPIKRSAALHTIGQRTSRITTPNSNRCSGRQATQNHPNDTLPPASHVGEAAVQRTPSQHSAGSAITSDHHALHAQQHTDFEPQAVNSTPPSWRRFMSKAGLPETPQQRHINSWGVVRC
jgi:hypothetical protein